MLWLLWIIYVDVVFCAPAPVFKGASNAPSSVHNSSLNLSISIPSGAQLGDLLIAVIAADNGFGCRNQYNYTARPVDATWIQLFTGVNATTEPQGNDNGEYALFWKILETSDPNPFNFVHGTATGCTTEFTGTIAAFGNVSLVNAAELVVNSGYVGPSWQFLLPNITVPADFTGWLLAIQAADQNYAYYNGNEPSVYVVPPDPYAVQHTFLSTDGWIPITFSVYPVGVSQKFYPSTNGIWVPPIWIHPSAGNCSTPCQNPPFCGNNGNIRDCQTQAWSYVIALRSVLDACVGYNLSLGLQVEGCSTDFIASTTNSTTATVISGAVEILTQNASDFSFTLPFDVRVRETKTREIIERGCTQPQVTCEWLNNATGQWEKSGCELVEDQVDLGQGILGATCQCNHLTVFCLMLRAELQAAPFCQAEEIDYVLIGLYTFVLGIGLVQFGRVALSIVERGKSISRRTLCVLSSQHFLLLLAVVFRILFLALKAVIGNGGGLIVVGLLPSALMLAMFLFVISAWAIIQLSAVTSDPFAQLKWPFAIVLLLVFGVTLVVLPVVYDQVSNEDAKKRTLVAGSYVLASLTFAVCALIFITGAGLVRTLRSSTSNSKDISTRILTSTCILSLLLFLQAAVWVAAVENEVLASTAATAAISAAFYVLDILAMCGLLLLLKPGVSKLRSSASSAHAAVKKDHDRSVTHSSQSLN